MLIIFQLLWKKTSFYNQLVEEMGCCTSSSKKSINLPLEQVNQNRQNTIKYPPNGVMSCGSNNKENQYESNNPTFEQANHYKTQTPIYTANGNIVYPLLQSKLNPYYATQQHERAYQQEENAQKKMKADGVSMIDYAANPSLFQKCSYCLSQFSQDFKPCLLSCGHFICKECFNTPKKCFVKKCSKAATIKNQNYWPWTQQQRGDIDTFDFTVYIGEHDHRGKSMSNVSGQDTFASVLNKIYAAKMLIQSIKTTNGASIMIQATTRPYNLIKDVKISTVAKELDIQKSYTGIMNKIKIVKAECGGQQK